MLSVYTRHYPPCRRTDPYFHCHCPKWLQGTLWPHRGRVRRSANTRNWRTAERRARAIERNADQAVAMVNSVTVEKAVTSFVAEQEAKRLAPPTLTKDKNFLLGRFLTWCADRRLKYLKQVSAAELREFRLKWSNHAWTARRKHERLRRLFKFCISNGWLQNNPMDLLEKPPVPKILPTNYFNRNEFEAGCRGDISLQLWWRKRLSLSRSTNSRVSSAHALEWVGD